MPAHFLFLDLPAELRIQTYKLLLNAQEPVEVRKYLNNRTLRTLTRTRKKAGTNARWTDVKNVKPNGIPAFMATCHRIYSEIGGMLYAGLTFHCERMSDFSEFTRTLGSTLAGLIETLQIRSHNYHFLTKLKVLTGLKTLVVLVGYDKRVLRPGWLRVQYPEHPRWHWPRRTQAIAALKKFAEAQECLVRFEFAGPDEMHRSRLLAAADIEATAVEMDEYVRGLWSQ